MQKTNKCNMKDTHLKHEHIPWLGDGEGELHAPLYEDSEKERKESHHSI
jgi:hypothetical protein